MILYRLLLTLAAPVIAFIFGLRLIRGREQAADLRERLGLDGPTSPPEGPVVWLHAASVGEHTAARSLLESMLRADPALRIVATANTITGRDLLRSWELPRVRARLAPLDMRACLGPFLRSHVPALLVSVEAELWPNRFRTLRAQGGSVSMVSARISKRSAERWASLRWLLPDVLAEVDLLSAQDSLSEARFRELGLPAKAVFPPMALKASVTLPEADPETLARYRQLYVRSETVLAASTHEGEEEIVLEAFANARRRRPSLKLILAPRHPERGEAVEVLIRRIGLPFRRRSRDEEPEETIYLADTLGEMGLWYRLAGITFVGGSLVPKGGHTPFEPAQAGSAIVHGPHLENAQSAYDALRDTGSSTQVEDAETLADAFAGLDADAQLWQAKRASEALGTGTDLSGLVAGLQTLWDRT